MAKKLPSVFISYSWTTQHHRDWVRGFAERLEENGVAVTADFWDLRPGQDADAFMERMVTSREIDKVLAICDRAYAEKADARRGGVGTEAQILSRDLYGRVDQTKVIPVVVESNTDGQGALPVFLRNRIFVDFRDGGSDEAHEELLRAIYDKPRHRRPSRGATPAFDTGATNVHDRRLPESESTTGRIVPLVYGRCAKCGHILPAPGDQGFQQCEGCGMMNENAGTREDLIGE
ncbi:MAG: toll/interleukin-1 receptor domain-containing protein [Pseudomonadota bacterium]